ncbi:hypothetical protein OKW45_002051 [Paraburkholderia sp. WSM4175]|uniref:hypothetical protein n=1 Tax=Paraburkholderia sp. WSM4175 TaxID=2991072 RepID=UPI003D1A2914
MRGKTIVYISISFHMGQDFPQAEKRRFALQHSAKALPHKAISLHAVRGAANFRASHFLDERSRACCTKSTKVI